MSDVMSTSDEGSTSTSASNSTSALNPLLLGESSPFQFDGDNFFRGCKWSPDGSCLLTLNNDNACRLFNLPCNLGSSSSSNVNPMVPVLEVKNPDLVYDMTWFPRMRSDEVATCVFLVSVGRNPIRLVDAYTGETRATYRTFDSGEKLIAPHSITFSPDGGSIYGGFHRTIRIFATGRPGSCIWEKNTRDQKVGLGIVSAITFHPKDETQFATGSLHKELTLWDTLSGSPTARLWGSKSGITHLCFSPDGNILFSGGRKDSQILGWDLRNLGKVACTMDRVVSTNQRIYFDVATSPNSDGWMLASGSKDGFLSIWDSSQMQPSTTGLTSHSNQFPSSIHPLVRVPLHRDCVNGISLHPSLPLMASCSGERKFPDIHDDESDDDPDGDNGGGNPDRSVHPITGSLHLQEEEGGRKKSESKGRLFSSRGTRRHNSVRIWSLSSQTVPNN